MLLLLFALSGPIVEPPQPPVEPTPVYYGSGRAKNHAQHNARDDLVRQVREKYAAIEAARANDAPDAAVEAKRADIVAEIKAKAAAKAKPAANSAPVAAKPAPAKVAAAPARIPLPALAMPAVTQRQAEDDQIMALMASMLMED